MIFTVDISKELDQLASRQRTARDRADEMVARITAEDRDFTADEQKAYDELKGEVVSLGKRAERLREMVKERSGAGTGTPRTQPKDVGGEDDETKSAQRRAVQRRAAFREWMRYGSESLSSEQRGMIQPVSMDQLRDQPEFRAMSAVLGSAGGFICPPEFTSQIDTAMKDYSGVLQAGVTVLPTSTGNDLPYPTVNDSSNEGEQVEEDTTVGNQDVSFGVINLKGYLFSSKLVLVPVQLIQDASVDVETLLANLLGERLGRITNRRLTTGSNINQPHGIVTAATQGKRAASATAITHDELVDLQHSIDPAYRMQAPRFMFADSTFAAIRKLKAGTDGRPIWQPAATAGAAAGAPATLLGDPYVLNNHMDGIAAGKRSVLYGATRKYIVRQIGGTILMRLTERYAEKLQVGFLAFRRLDGRLIDAGTNPVKYLDHP